MVWKYELYEPDLRAPLVDKTKTERNPIRAHDAEDVQCEFHSNESACFMLHKLVQPRS